MPKLDDDPEPLNGLYLGEISQDFVRVAELLREAGYQVRARKISAHPIFPICRVAQPIGMQLISGPAQDLIFNYYLSYLDEFVQRGLIPADGLEAFAAAYKDPDEYACLFVVDERFTNYVFIPYPTDDDNQQEESPNSLADEPEELSEDDLIDRDLY